MAWLDLGVLQRRKSLQHLERFPEYVIRRPDDKLLIAITGKRFHSLQSEHIAVVVNPDVSHATTPVFERCYWCDFDPVGEVRCRFRFGLLIHNNKKANKAAQTNRLPVPSSIFSGYFNGWLRVAASPLGLVF